MRVFLSWSGVRSKMVAEGFADWLRQVIQATDPWLSSDIEKGVRWGPEVAENLETSRVGILCLTPENLAEPWILFEAGALSKTRDAHLCTLLLGLKPAHIAPPLAQFQHTTTDKAEILKLLTAVNSAVEKAGEKALPESTLHTVFETNWPQLEKLFSTAMQLPAAASTPTRTPADLLGEVLDLVRSNDHLLKSLAGALGILQTLLQQYLEGLRSTTAKEPNLRDIFTLRAGDYHTMQLSEALRSTNPMTIRQAFGLLSDEDKDGLLALSRKRPPGQVIPDIETTKEAEETPSKPDKKKE